MKKGKLIITKEDGEGNLTYYKTIREAKRIGDGAHIVLPKNLIGKEVKVEWGNEE